jgi:hypothetical protein
MCESYKDKQLAGPEAVDETKLIIAETNTLTFQMHNKQLYYRVLDLLEDNGLGFTVIER